MRRCVSCQAPVVDSASFCTACGARLPATETSEQQEALEPDQATQLSDPLVGRVIARNFRVEALLGVGGMGKVYRATQISLEKTIALKVLHAQYTSDETLVHRFKREARAASRLSHPNIIQVIDFGTDRGGLLYMAMEFLSGRDLAGLLREDFPLGDQRVAQIGLQVCAALIEAHSKGVIHRDLKPSNIVVDSRPEQPDFIKLFDFGIAKVETPHGRQSRILTTGGVVCGTPEYMSPEQIRGQTLDPRCDLYSLGVMLYQLSTRQLPFRADSPIDVAAKHVTALPLPPRQIRPEISHELETIILRCLQKKPEARFASAQALAQALRPIAENVQTSVDVMFNEKSIQRRLPDEAFATDAEITDPVVATASDLDAATLRDSNFLDEETTAHIGAGSHRAPFIAPGDADAGSAHAEPLRPLRTPGGAAVSTDKSASKASFFATEDDLPSSPDEARPGSTRSAAHRALPYAVAIALLLAATLMAVSLWLNRTPPSGASRPDGSVAVGSALSPGADASALSDTPPSATSAHTSTAPTLPAAPQHLVPAAAHPRLDNKHAAPKPPTKSIGRRVQRRHVRELLRKGDKRHMAGDYAEALHFYRKARDLAPANAQVHRKLAMAHYNLGNQAQACKSFEMYFRLSSHPQGEARLRQFVRSICQP